MFCFDHFHLEFEARIWWFCSTDEYSFGAEYELQTPRGSGRTRCHVPVFSAAEWATFTITIKKHCYMFFSEDRYFSCHNGYIGYFASISS